MTDRMARWLASAAVALFVVIGSLGSSQSVEVVVVSAVVAVGATLFMRSTGPMLGVLAVLSGAAIAVLCTGWASNIGWFAICVLAAWCALRGGAAIGVGFATAAIGMFVVEWATVHSDPGWAAWIAGTVFATVICLMQRRQGHLIDQLRLAQAGLADRARVEERNRIARELHDVIAHSLTVSLLHVTSARLSVEEDPGEAAGALAEAERLGRQSLTEVRLAVGLLRSGDAPSDAPLPGVGQVPTLVDGFRRAGVQLRYDVLGEPGELSSTTGLTVYRILQEALTNAARHAPGTETRVQMDVTAARTVLTIDSGAAPGADTGDGVGLHSMRERAAALGGTVEAGPSATGWRVRAVLPRESVGAKAPSG